MLNKLKSESVYLKPLPKLFRQRLFRAGIDNTVFALHSSIYAGYMSGVLVFDGIIELHDEADGRGHIVRQKESEQLVLCGHGENVFIPGVIRKLGDKRFAQLIQYGRVRVCKTHPDGRRQKFMVKGEVFKLRPVFLKLPLKFIVAAKVVGCVDDLEVLFDMGVIRD